MNYYKNKLLILPKSIFTEKDLHILLYEKSDKDTVIIVDEYNFNSLKNFKFPNKEIVLIEKISKKDVEEVKRITQDTNIVAIGGCSALDFGRACANENRNIFLFPSILSTACISVNKSIIYDEENNYEIITTPVPDEIIISWPLILSTKSSELEKWSASGFGDIVAKISGVIDFLFKKDMLKPNISIISLLNEFFIKHHLLNILEIVEWGVKRFVRFDKNTLKILAQWSYQVGIETILEETNISAAGEHELYYMMLKQQNYDKKCPTHGQLVTIGTLLSAKIIEKVFGEKILFEQLKKAFQKIGIPVTYSELEKINVKREHILAGIKELKKDWFLSYFFDEKFLDECYEK